MSEATRKGVRLTSETDQHFYLCPRCVDNPRRKMPEVVFLMILDYPTAKTVDGGECYGCGDYFGDLVNNTFKCHGVEWFDGDKCLECETLASKKGNK